MTKKVLKKLLVPGNEKLGKGIWHFSMPAIHTCPGKTKTCSSLCYATQGTFYYPSVIQSHRERRAARNAQSFVLRIVNEIKKKNIQTVRIHTSGDFDSVKYIQKWIAIARACPKTTFFFYTRSWREPALVRSINVLGSLFNVVGWYSCDKDTGAPPLNKNFYRAYMAIDDMDVPRYNVDLTFRVERKSLMRFASDGSFVCPVERQSNADRKKLNCGTCGICHSRPEWLKAVHKKAKAPGTGVLQLPILENDNATN